LPHTLAARERAGGRKHAGREKSVADKHIHQSYRISLKNCSFRGLRMTQTFNGRVRAAFGALVLAVLSLPAAASQGGPGPWWQVPGTQKELGLTTEQVVKINTIWDSTVTELRQEKDELDKWEQRLSRMINRNAPEADVARQIDRVETARASLNKTRSLMLYRMRQVLTPEQNTKFQAMQERWQQQNAGRGGASKPAAPPPARKSHQSNAP
jgi:Spy/CpxP family protein refolding chaperone